MERREHILFQPPLRRALSPGLGSFERLGRRLWPAFGAVYVIRAVKRVSTLTPVRPLWQTRRGLLPSAIEPTVGCRYQGTRPGVGTQARTGGLHLG